MQYLCSDLHLSHDNVLKFDKGRGEKFKTINAHDERIMSELISLDRKDEVYMLGDFVWKMDKETEKLICMYLSQVKAKLYWIRGNHDYDRIVEKYAQYFEWIGYYKELKYMKRKFILMHYPIESRNGKDRGYIHVHGHTHHNQSHESKSVKNRICICFDGYKLLRTIDEILYTLEQGLDS